MPKVYHYDHGDTHTIIMDTKVTPKPPEGINGTVTIRMFLDGNDVRWPGRDLDAEARALVDRFDGWVEDID